MKKIVLISIIFFALSNIKANEIDSLKQIISTLTNNTERVDKTNILSEILLTSSEYDSAIYNLHKILITKKVRLMHG